VSLTASASIDVLIVNYNSTDDLRDCLTSLDGEEIRQIVIVDNASNPDQLSELEPIVSGRENTSLVLSSQNLGFAGGVNRAFDQTTGAEDDLILVLNPDTTVSPGTAGLLATALRETGADIVSPVIRTGHGASGAVWYGGGTIDVRKGESYLTAEEPRKPMSNFSQTDFVSGAALMTSRKTWQALEGFRTDLFLYWEHTDLSLRAAKAGLVLGVVPGAIIWHRVGGSGDRSGKSTSYYYYMARNRLIVCGEYGSRLSILLVRGARATIRLVARASREEHASASKIFAVARGSLSGVMSRRSN
jgi:N-acetylglucosaminyl-diphospho-decaprenol L-rhamnosyltransferase